MLRASFNTSVLAVQPQAQDADLPSMVAESNQKSWTEILEQHARLATNPTADAATDGSIDGWRLSETVKHSVMHRCDYTQPVTPILAEPLLQVPLSHGGLASELMHASTKPQSPVYLPLACAQRSVLGGCKATYCSLVVQDMGLQDTVTTLPVVLFDDSSSCSTDEAESREDTWQRCVSDCHIKQLKTGHLKLYMDWSLSDRSASSSKTLHEYKRHLDQTLRPASLPEVAADSSLDDSLSAAIVTHSIAGAKMTPPGVPYNAMRQPEQLPHAVKARLQAQAQRAKQAQHAQHANLQQGRQLSKVWAPKLSRQAALAVALKPAACTNARTDPASGAAAMLPSDKDSKSVQPASPARQSANNPDPARQTHATGVFQTRQATRKARSSAKRKVESSGNDMAYFLGLQQGAAPNHPALKTLQPRAPALASGAGPALGPASKAGQCQVIDLCADDASQEEEEDTLVIELPDVQYSILCLPERHQGLLQRMKEEHTAILRHHASIGAEVRCHRNSWGPSDWGSSCMYRCACVCQKRLPQYQHISSSHQGYYGHLAVNSCVEDID